MFELKIEPRAGSMYKDDNDRIISSIKNGRDRKLQSVLRDAERDNKKLYIEKRFVDARHGKAKVIFRFDFITAEEEQARRDSLIKDTLPYLGKKFNSGTDRPVIVGFGPAGIFAALVLARYGLKPIVIERGSAMAQRIKDVDSFRAGSSMINPENNIQFGEGGAGTFSDGKLYTGLSSGIKGFVADVFVSHGADKSILYDSHPHIGTDRLRDVIVSIREEIISLGGEVFFDTRLTSIEHSNGLVTGITVANNGSSRQIACSNVILAVGNSSRDTFRHLYSSDVQMESKPFAIGVRIEHKRRDIDMSQYGIDTADTSDLTAANYKLVVETSNGRKLYTFCMCPGGEVINGISGDGQCVVNGMSLFARDNENSNSALLVPVDSSDFGDGVLAGLEYQELLERKAFEATGDCKKIPVTKYKDLKTGETDDFEYIKPTVKPGYKACAFDKIFDEEIIDTIDEGIRLMGKKIKGFDNPDSVLSAVESRSSSPVRIVRDRDTRVSVSLKGLYPAGEGAGYAGGIMSSAIDGINCANSLSFSLINK